MNEGHWTVKETKDFALEKIKTNLLESGKRSTSFNHYMPGDKDEGVPPKATLKGVLEDLEVEGKITIDASYSEGFTVSITTDYQSELEEGQ